jgi:hypothetical protein
VKVSELDGMLIRRDACGKLAVKSGGAWVPLGSRVREWAYSMRRFARFGDWSVQDVNAGSACRGTVRARISGPNGSVEAWNGMEVFYIPKGVKPLKSPYPDCEREDAGNGIVFWPRLTYRSGVYTGRDKYGQYAMDSREHFARCIEQACAMAGIQERMEL